MDDELGTCECCGSDEMELMDCENHKDCGSRNYCYVCLNHCGEWQLPFCDACIDAGVEIFQHIDE